MKKIFILYFVLMLAAFVSITKAQSEYPDILSDRLGLTKGSSVIPQDLFQIEFGTSYQDQKHKEKTTAYEIENFTLGSILCRYGINEKLEFRFGGEFFNRRTTVNDSSSNVQGPQNIFVGAKVQLLKNNNLIPNAGLILEIALPFGNEKLRPATFEPRIILAVDKYILDELALGINVGVVNDPNLGKNIYSFSTLINYDLTKKIGALAEYYANAVSNELTQHNIYCGLTYRVRKNVQVDCSAGRIISSNISNWTFRIGVAIRSPH